MPRLKPTLGYRSRQAAIEALHDRGLSNVKIAQELGVTQNVVGTTLCYVRNGRRRSQRRTERAVIVSTDTLARLRVDADARAMSVNKLVRLLLDHIADDNLVSAILDDETT